MAAGCTVVLKPSEVAPLDAFILAEVIDEVGLPAGVFNLVTGIGPVVGEAIAAHPDVDMVSFTGSTRAGQARRRARAPRRSSAVALELGGKSANVLLDDLDLTSAEAVRDGVGKCVPELGPDLLARSPACSCRARGSPRPSGSRPTVGRRSRSATRSPTASTSARSSRRRSATGCSGYIQKGIDEGATLVTGGARRARGPRHRLLRAADGVLQRRRPT